MSKKDPNKLSEQLSAYLDGELSERERHAIERTLANDAAARALLEELRSTVKLLHDLPRRNAPDTLLPELIEAMERRQLLDGTDAVVRPTDGARLLFPLLGLAAALALAVTLGLRAGLFSRHAPSQLGPVSSNYREHALPQTTPASNLREFSQPNKQQSDELLAMASRGHPEQSGFAADEPAGSSRMSGQASRTEIAARDAIRSLAQEDAAPAEIADGVQPPSSAPLDTAFVLSASFKDLAERDATASIIAGYLDTCNAVLPESFGRKEKPFGKAAIGGAGGADRGRVLTTQPATYTVEIPASQLDVCLGGVARAAAQAPQLELACGPFVAHGADEIRTLVQFVRGPQTPVAAPPATAPPGAAPAAGNLDQDASAERLRAGFAQFVDHLRRLVSPAESQPARIDADDKAGADLDTASTESQPASQTMPSSADALGTPRSVKLVIRLMVAPPSDDAAGPAAASQPIPGDAP